MRVGLKNIILFLTLGSCTENKLPNKKEYFYSFSSQTGDTVRAYLQTKVDTSSFIVLANCTFTDAKFKGRVIKFAMKNPPIDGDFELYSTPDLGVIYSKSPVWGNYTRLHSTNDSIERRINSYLEHILSNTKMVKARIFKESIICGSDTIVCD